MTDLLPVRYSDEGALLIADPDTGLLHLIPDAPEPVLARVAALLDDMAREARRVRSTLGDELLERMGAERKLDAGSHAVSAERRSEWDADATWEALTGLVDAGLVSAKDADEAMPERTVRKPDGRRLNALLTSVVGEDPVAAQALARARSDRRWVKVSATSVDGSVA